MHHDNSSSPHSTGVPAALPLTGLVAGLALGPLLVHPTPTILAAVAAAILISIPRALRDRLGPRAFLLFLALGVALTPRAHGVPHFDPERFVDLEVPLERDWGVRDEAFVLRATHFRANGIDVDLPLSVYARFEPPEMAMEATLRAEALVRENERGGLTATIKAPQLMRYEGELARWHPAAWNRMLANRLEPHAARYAEEVALAQALILGRGERLTAEMRESFRRGGTYHLLVFSGLQIAFAAGVLAALLRWLGTPRVSDWLLLAFAALAPPFIGGSASVSRASIAIGLYALSRLLKRPTSIENLWCVAAMARLLVEPRDLTDVSFHLTYAGAGALLFLGKSAVRSRVVRTLRHLAAVELAITPLTLFHFRQYALGGAAVTLAMAPVIFAMLVASAAACAWPHDFVFETIRMLHRACIVLNAFGLAGWFAAPPLAALLCGAAIALLSIALLRGRTRTIVLAAALLVPTVAAVARSWRAARIETPRVTFLDVGQGDAIAVRTARRTILVDGGRGDRVLSLLADRGVRRIDVAVLTHAHPDHCAGLARVVEEIPTGALWISPRRFRGDCATLMLRAASASQTPIRLVRDGDVLALDDLHVTAHLAEIRFRRAPENNSSIVLRARVGGRAFLLTGDVEKEAELT
ncbi:MAG TPA: ComEC/Rec2 family competence protein, partial [Thermoanaerobaculia bacterium]|nr:ComEC/Rec2 family competence protein [Thermoanaerobaculia bacterium]